MPTDPAHGQFVPGGRTLARVLRRIFRRMGAAALHEARRGRVARLEPWVKVIEEHCAAVLAGYFQDGGEITLRRIRRLLRERPAKSFRAKAGTGLEIPAALTAAETSDAFSVFLPEVRAAVRALALRFARSTVRDATVSLAELVRRVRAELEAGLSAGDAAKTLTERISDLFGSPLRAQRIALTEASRAMHAGQREAALRSGVVAGWRWLASADACPLCRALNNRVVGRDQAFYVDPRGGPYAVVEHPPRHPFCMCSVTEVLE